MVAAAKIQANRNTEATALATLGFDFVLQELIAVIREGLKRDGLVRLHQFGTFRLKYSKSRVYRNPNTGATRILPPTPLVSFKPAKQLRDQIQATKAPAIAVSQAEIARNTTAPISPAVLAPRAQVAVINKHPAANSVMNDPADLPSLHATEKSAAQSSTRHPLAAFLGISALGLFAAVPFILSTLQKDFDDTDIVTATSHATVMTNSIEAAAGSVATTTPVDSVAVPTEPAKQSKPPADETGQGDNNFFLKPLIKTVTRGDSLWKLAQLHYGDSRLWPYIYRANQRVIENPDIIDTGMRLVIPGLQGNMQALTGRDRENIAEGYYLLYRYYLHRGDSNARDFLLGAHGFDNRVLEKQRLALG
ncbi:MAG: HU family DNA-binding protein [Gammaproteobacteria bacterium]|nr:HU family DNA-binding protein [Gammaproteobacteria bacterium]